jgi:hypothetical protein
MPGKRKKVLKRQPSKSARKKILEGILRALKRDPALLKELARRMVEDEVVD